MRQTLNIILLGLNEINPSEPSPILSETSQVVLFYAKSARVELYRIDRGDDK